MGNQGLTHPAILADSGILGDLDWSGSDFIRNTLTSTNESNAYLPAYQESQGRTAASRAHESRQYRPLSWD